MRVWGQFGNLPTVFIVEIQSTTQKLSTILFTSRCHCGLWTAISRPPMDSM